LREGWDCLTYAKIEEDSHAGRGRDFQKDQRKTDPKFKVVRNAYNLPKENGGNLKEFWGKDSQWGGGVNLFGGWGSMQQHGILASGGNVHASGENTKIEREQQNQN